LKEKTSLESIECNVGEFITLNKETLEQKERLSMILKNRITELGDKLKQC
jgi:hypothetical protein